MNLSQTTRERIIKGVGNTATNLLKANSILGSSTQPGVADVMGIYRYLKGSSQTRHVGMEDIIRTSKKSTRNPTGKPLSSQTGQDIPSPSPGGAPACSPEDQQEKKQEHEKPEAMAIF